MDAISVGVLVFGCQDNYLINTDSEWTDGQSVNVVAVSSNYSYTHPVSAQPPSHPGSARLTA